ncbi:hypothetical protein [Nocardioides sp.]|uniref:hypothetical protein n=1 Tax=Nocardioides sp. TaxID=35761 RepID=UPI0026232639|nr:hypothetical protein [Nocardioides sp.]
MELQLRSRRLTRLGHRQVLVSVAALLLGWLVLVTLVPGMFGLRTTVLDETRGDYEQGTLVVTRSVPTSDVESHDLLAAGDGMWRVLSVEQGTVRAQDALASSATEASTTAMRSGDTPTIDRAVLVLPVVGLPLAGAQGLVLWVLAALVACGAALAASTFLGFLGSGRLRPGPESTLSVPTSG